MTCPFQYKLSESRQQSTTEFPITDDDLSDVSDDSSLTLSNLNSAIRLLTSPLNTDVNNAIQSVIRKYGDEKPDVLKL